MVTLNDCFYVGLNFFFFYHGVSSFIFFLSKKHYPHLYKENHFYVQQKKKYDKNKCTLVNVLFRFREYIYVQKQTKKQQNSQPTNG